MFRLSLLVLALAAPSIVHADVAPLVPHATTSIAIASDDATHVWVAYPLNYSHGVPMEAYAQITPGAPLDPGRGSPTIYSFPAASVVDVAPSVRGLLGASRGFGQSDTAFGDHTLEGFFAAASVPHATLLSPPDDAALVALHVTSLVDTYAPTLEASALRLRLVQTEYTFADGHAQSVPANADGSRALPNAPPPTTAPPAAPPPSTTTSAPAAPAASGWGCSVGARSSGAMFGLGLLALVAIARRRAH